MFNLLVLFVMINVPFDVPMIQAGEFKATFVQNSALAASICKSFFKTSLWNSSASSITRGTCKDIYTEIKFYSIFYLFVFVT